MANILLKRGSGDPSTSLVFAEPAFDYVNNIFYIGTGTSAIPFYPYTQFFPYDIFNGGNDWITPLYDYINGGNDWTTLIEDKINGGSW